MEPGQNHRFLNCASVVRKSSVAVAETVARLVWEAWGGAYGVDVEHHYIDHPVPTSKTPA